MAVGRSLMAWPGLKTQQHFQAAAARKSAAFGAVGIKNCVFPAEMSVHMKPREKVNRFTLNLYFNIGETTVSYTKKHKDIR